MTTTAQKLAKLTATLTAARPFAAAAIAELDDDLGSCNFDSVFLPTGRGHTFGRASKAIERAIEAAPGCSCFRHGGSWRKGYVISVGLGGQGATRTKAHELVRHALVGAGFDASMWYALD